MFFFFLRLKIIFLTFSAESFPFTCSVSIYCIPTFVTDKLWFFIWGLPLLRKLSETLRSIYVMVSSLATAFASPKKLLSQSLCWISWSISNWDNILYLYNIDVLKYSEKPEPGDERPQNGHLDPVHAEPVNYAQEPGPKCSRRRNTAALPGQQNRAKKLFQILDSETKWAQRIPR